MNEEASKMSVILVNLIREEMIRRVKEWRVKNDTLSDVLIKTFVLLHLLTDGIEFS